MIFLSKRVTLGLTLLFRKTSFTIFLKHRLKSWSVLFFGSDSFSIVTLENLFKCLEKKKLNNLEVVSLSDTNLVSQYANEKNIKLHIWPPALTQYYDIGVVVSFGKLIPKRIIDHFPLGIINVHPSLLPQYRGAMPIFHAIKNGESLTGVTIMKIKPHKFDAGDIIMQETCEIGSDVLQPFLRKKLAYIGAKCLVDTINSLPYSLEKCVPQCSDKVSLAPKITKDISIIQWDKMRASEVYDLYRALHGIHDVKTRWCSQWVKLTCVSPYFTRKSVLFNKLTRLAPGTLEYCSETKCLRVHCVDKPLYVCSIKVNHKILTAFDFYRGYLQRMSKDEWIFT